MRQEIDSTEHRARVICKLLAQDLALGIDKLRLASAPNFSEPAKRRRHLRSLTTPDEFERAMALAIAQTRQKYADQFDLGGSRGWSAHTGRTASQPMDVGLDVDRRLPGVRGRLLGIWRRFGPVPHSSLADE
jgi:hypothetical protein